jgi:hypothetical protein
MRGRQRAAARTGLGGRGLRLTLALDDVLEEQIVVGVGELHAERALRRKLSPTR